MCVSGGSHQGYKLGEEVPHSAYKSSVQIAQVATRDFPSRIMSGSRCVKVLALSSAEFCIALSSQHLIEQTILFLFCIYKSSNSFDNICGESDRNV